MDTSAENTDQPSAEGGKTLVVYYSATGNTESVAGYIAAATDADIFVLEPVEPYSSEDLNWTDENSRVVYEHDNPEARNVELVSTTVNDWESLPFPAQSVLHPSGFPFPVPAGRTAPVYFPASHLPFPAGPAAYCSRCSGCRTP